MWRLLEVGERINSCTDATYQDIYKCSECNHQWGTGKIYLT